MDTQLTTTEARVLGCLIEKAATVPDQYPLSFNALLNACNQKTSREPVMDLTTDEVSEALRTLQEKGLARERLGSRVPKFAHYAEHLGAGDSPETFALLAMLMLRGPQTASELKTRTERMAQFRDKVDVEAHLEKLLNDEEGPFVASLARGRYQHLFCGEAPTQTAGRSPAPAPDRVKELEQRVTQLEDRVAELEARLTPSPGS